MVHAQVIRSVWVNMHPLGERDLGAFGVLRGVRVEVTVMFAGRCCRGRPGVRRFELLVCCTTCSSAVVDQFRKGRLKQYEIQNRRKRMNE